MAKKKKKTVHAVVPSLGGFRDAVIALDVGSGFVKSSKGVRIKRIPTRYWRLRLTIGSANGVIYAK